VSGEAALIAMEIGDLASARALLERQWPSSERMATVRIWPEPGNHLGRVLLAQSDVAAARQKFRERLLVGRDMGLTAQIAQALLGLASVAKREEAVERALTLFAVVSSLPSQPTRACRRFGVR
jgi:hypothetical protein